MVGYKQLKDGEYGNGGGRTSDYKLYATQNSYGVA